MGSARYMDHSPVNELFIVDYGQHITPNQLESFKAACQRWECNLRIVTDETVNVTYAPQALKLKVFEFSDADKIMVLDSDTIIRFDTPSPFELSSSFVACKNKQPHMGWYIEANGKIEREEMDRIFSAGFEPVNFNYNLFINSGMFIVSQEHKPVLDLAFDVFSKAPLGWWDQAALNYALARFKTSIYNPGDEWNYQIPSQLEPMMAYIYHFAGSPSRYQVLSTLNWRVAL